MVKVNISYRGKGLDSIEIKGHADSAEIGRDIVCAAVSAVSVGAMNALENDEDFEIEIEEGYVSCKSKGAISEHDQVVLETLIVQLKTIEISYKEYLTIKERKN